jgi:hypothetical protein
MSRRTAAFAALALAAAALVAPSAGVAARPVALSHSLHVDLTEWAVVPSQGLVSAGPLRVTVQNYGRLAHQLEIIPTSSWGEQLRVRDGRAVGVVVPHPVIVAPGGRHAVDVYLSPGSYVLLDNLRGHYALGAAVSIVAA